MTEEKELIDAVTSSIKEELNLKDVKLSTEGGTSDGRFIAPTGYELRQMLVPIITEITDKNLPKTWRL